MWTDWFARWIVIALLATVDAAWLWTEGVGFEVDALGPRFRIAGVFLIWCLLSALLIGRLKRFSRVLIASSDFFYSAMQLLLLVPPTVTLTYLAATVNAPLADAALLHADQFLGVDWHALDGWVMAQPWLVETLRFAYRTMLWQPLAVLFAVSVSRPGEANSELIWSFVVGVILCASISIVMPALGYDGMIGHAHIGALEEIRAGAWRTLDFNRVDGIITFPSFHAALGVLFPYAVRRVRWALAWALPLNLVMILSTPTVGGHYIVDVLGGIALAVVSIVIAQAIRRGTARLGRYAAASRARAIAAHSPSSEPSATVLPASRYQ